MIVGMPSATLSAPFSNPHSVATSMQTATAIQIE